MNSIKCKLRLSFETIEVEFYMVDGDIIWWPTCNTSIMKPHADKTALAATELTHQRSIEKNNHFYDVENGSVIFMSQTTLRFTIKNHTFN